MSSKKGQNSILLLTTLGVYIGLLMAGATPGVIAQQAALTRNFELSEEVEVKDDLDKDPRDEAVETDDEVDVRSIEIVVSSYLSRVLNFDSERDSGLSGFVASATRFEVQDDFEVPASLRHSAADVQNSPNFTTQRFPRAGL